MKPYKRLNSLLILCLVFYFSPDAFSANKSGPVIELRKHQFYVNGRPFFVKAVSYNPFRPVVKGAKGKDALELVNSDFKRIKAAGFNTIRGQYTLPPEQISLAAKHGLYVIQSLSLPRVLGGDLSAWEKEALNKTDNILSYSSGAGNILMYIIPFDLSPQVITESGEDKIADFLSRLMRRVKEKDYKAVSVESRAQNAFLLMDRGDVVSFAAFDFMPSCLNQVMGFEGYLEWLRYTYSEGRPFFISLSGAHCAYSIDEANLDFGSLDEDKQSKLIIEDINDIRRSGSLGYCVFSWLDEWGYVEESDAYSDTPWEWTGIIAVDVDKDALGKPRKAYWDLKKYNAGIPDSQEVVIPKLDEEGLICSIMPSEIMYSLEDKITMEVMVTDKENKPRPGVMATYCFFAPLNWMAEKGALTTNKDGRVFPVCGLDLERKVQYLVFAVSVKDRGRTFGDIIFLKIQPKAEK